MIVGARRTRVRVAGAAIAAIMAGIYVLIGLGVLDAGRPTEEQRAGLLFFGLSAGAMFLLGAILLLASDRRRLWIVGAVLQVLVVLAYISVAPTRIPHYEMWGITLRLLQVPLFLALVYLAVRRPDPSTVAVGSTPPARDRIAG
jgi:hypothetical protein